MTVDMLFIMSAVLAFGLPLFSSAFRISFSVFVVVLCQSTSALRTLYDSFYHESMSSPVRPSPRTVPKSSGSTDRRQKHSHLSRSNHNLPTIQYSVQNAFSTTSLATLDKQSNHLPIDLEIDLYQNLANQHPHLFCLLCYPNVQPDRQ